MRTQKMEKDKTSLVLQSLQQSSPCYVEGSTPEEHIESIRFNLFGINSGRAKNMDHAENANNAIAKLAMTAHASPFHFMCELIQVSKNSVEWEGSFLHFPGVFCLLVFV